MTNEPLKATHTPLPWTAERDIPHNRMPRVHSSADGSLICECGNMGTTQDQWEANAAFIVHAVNSHHDLIEALRAVIEVAHGYAEYISSVPSAELERHPYLPGLEDQINEARAILTKEVGHGVQ